MKALILAAGMGTRLDDLTANRPKALVTVNNKELLSHVFDFLDHPSVAKKAVVTGYCSELLTNFVKKHFPATEMFFNPNFSQGSIRTIETALSFLDDDFLLLNVDHIYPQKMLHVILNNCEGITAICDFDRKLVSDDMKVKLDSNKNLKKIMKTLTDYDGGYIGMTFCDKAHLKTYREAVKETRKVHGDNISVEYVLGHLANNGVKINICDVSGIGWFEVDTKEDLKVAENKLSSNLK